MRLIDAEALADALFEKRKNYPQWVADTIGKMPDAVVRCKDCKYAAPDMACSHESEWGNEISRNRCNPNWFCADGKQKECR